MKSNTTFLFIIFLNLITIRAYTQETFCPSLCVTDISIDTTGVNQMYVTIYFSGEDNDFINYPLVDAVVDALGDTIGVGFNWFFGQIGNTSLTYPLNTSLDSLPSDFTGTVVFTYDTVTCLLNYPCFATSIENPRTDHSILISPNPFSTETEIHGDQPFQDLSIRIYDIHGLFVRTWDHLTGETITLSRNGLYPGVYFIQFSEKKKIIGVSKLMIAD